MHPDTRRAILAMINGIDQQLATIRSLIGLDTGAQVVVPPGKPRERERLPVAYLSDDEDEALAEELGVNAVEAAEKHAQAVGKEESSVQALMHQALANMAPYTEGARNAAFLRGTMGGE